MASEPRRLAHDAFISYRHARDGELAEALETGLQSLGRPWLGRRTLDVIRDTSDLSTSPNLWQSIATHLDQSRFLILLASPESAASPWVAREIEHWVDLGRNEQLLLVLTAGALRWNDAERRFDPSVEDNAASAALDGVFASEPLWLDMRGVRTGAAQYEAGLSLDNPVFKLDVARLQSPIRRMRVSDIFADDLEQFRKGRRRRRLSVAGLMTLGAISLIFGIVSTVLFGTVGSLEDQQKSLEESVTSLETDRENLMLSVGGLENDKLELTGEIEGLETQKEEVEADLEAQQLVADSRRLAIESTLHRNDDSDLALLLGLAALDRANQASEMGRAEVSLSEPAAVLFESLLLLDRDAVATIQDVDFGVLSLDGPPGGSVFATGGADGSVRLWALRAGALTLTDSAFLTDGNDCEGVSASSIESVDFALVGGVTYLISGAGHQAAAGSEFCPNGGQARLDLWEVVGPPERPTLRHRDVKLAGQGWIGAIAVDQAGCDVGDCPVAVAGRRDGGPKLWMWDVGSGLLEPVGELQRNENGFANRVSWAHPDAWPGGRRIAAVAAQFGIELWDLTDPERPRLAGDLRGGSVEVPGLLTGAEWHPSDRLLLSTSEDGRVRVHDLGGPRVDDPAVELPGPESAFNYATWHPTIPIVVAGTTDFTIWMWDVTNPLRPRRLMQPLEFHTEVVNALAVSSDGQMLLSGSKGSGRNRFVVSPVGVEAMREIACALVGRDFRAEELPLFIGTTEPLDLCGG